MTMKSGIYRIGLVGIWFYIGSACDLCRRKSEHRCHLRAEKHSDTWAQNCWNKYWVFEFEVLEYCEKSELRDREQFHLNIHFGTLGCVNLCPTAGDTTGRKPTAKMIDAVQRRNASPEAVDALRRWNASPEAKAHRERVAASRVGVQRSEAVKAKLSVSHIESPKAKTHRDQLAKSRCDVPLSDDHKKNVSDGLKNSPKVKANIDRLAEANRGVSHSDESIVKMSLARSAWWARKRLEVMP